MGPIRAGFVAADDLFLANRPRRIQIVADKHRNLAIRPRPSATTLDHACGVRWPYEVHAATAATHRFHI